MSGGRWTTIWIMCASDKGPTKQRREFLFCFFPTELKKVAGDGSSNCNLLLPNKLQLLIFQ